MEDHSFDPLMSSTVEVEEEDEVEFHRPSQHREAEDVLSSPSRATRMSSSMLSDLSFENDHLDATMTGDNDHVRHDEDGSEAEGESNSDDERAPAECSGPFDAATLFEDDEGFVCFRGEEIQRSDYIRYLGKIVEESWVNKASPSFPPPSCTIDAFHYLVKITDAYSVKVLDGLPSDLVVAHYEAFEYANQEGKTCRGIGTRYMHARFSCVVGRHSHITHHDFVFSSKLKASLTTFYKEWIRRSFGIVHF